MGSFQMRNVSAGSRLWIEALTVGIKLMFIQKEFEYRDGSILAGFGIFRFSEF